jgi:hypothetical protein
MRERGDEKETLKAHLNKFRTITQTKKYAAA